MKILHAPKNIAGQPATISRAERVLGLKSDVLVYYQFYFNFECDINLDLKNKNPILILPILGINFIKCLVKYDTFHFHFGWTFLPDFIFPFDLIILKLFGKKTVMHYWGSDVLQTDISIDYTLLTKKKWDELYPKLNNAKKRKRIQLIENLVNLSVVGDYSLLPYSPKSIVIRQAIDLNKFPFVGSETKKSSVKIIHAPTTRGVKGTELIISVIEQLKNDKYSIDFVLIENKPHDEAIKMFMEADIVIDDILMGPYGILAIECMALGKPVLDHIHDNLVHYYPGLPIVNVTPDTLYNSLKILIENPDLRKELGIKGREYVEKNHDSKIIAQQCFELYQSLH